MKALLIGINSKYIHPSVALYQLRANTTYECDLIELTIKDSIDKCIEKINRKNYDLEFDELSEDKLSILKQEIYQKTLKRSTLYRHIN